MSECSGFSFLKMGLLVVVAIVRCDDRWARWGGTGGGRLGPLEARGARALGAPTSSIAVPTLPRSSTYARRHSPVVRSAGVDSAMTRYSSCTQLTSEYLARPGEVVGWLALTLSPGFGINNECSEIDEALAHTPAGYGWEAQHLGKLVVLTATGAWSLACLSQGILE